MTYLAYRPLKKVVKQKKFLRTWAVTKRRNHVVRLSRYHQGRYLICEQDQREIKKIKSYGGSKISGIVRLDMLLDNLDVPTL